MHFDELIHDLLVIVTAGFLAGSVCRRLNISMLIGYLIAGAVIGHGGLGFVAEEGDELAHIAEAGALLLLFAVGIEFSLEELKRLSRFFLIGGPTQMIAVAAPLILVGRFYGLPWNAAILAGSAGALSSTVLVFKALTELGQTPTPHGRRAIGVLLFQDVALVPLMLLIPLLTGGDDGPSADQYGRLLAESVIFVAAIAVLRWLFASFMVPWLIRMRSVELVVLFTLTLLGGICVGSEWIGIPAAVGALAAGLVMSGNRLSKQIDTVVLPFRETFAAIFFVSLGTLLDVRTFLEAPVLLSTGLVAMIALKTGAAALALRATGLSWQAAFGMGLGLSQLGEFSFLVVSAGVGTGLIDEDTYHRMLFVALGTLILTPQLLKIGLRWCHGYADESHDRVRFGEDLTELPRALIVGIGPIGKAVASQLETSGVDTVLLDQSPINVYPFAQIGFSTVAGDARDPRILRDAKIEDRTLVVICVPDDAVAQQVVRSVRSLNQSASVLVRCRYQSNSQALQSAGADEVVSEETEASGKLLGLCRDLLMRESEHHEQDESL
ncbi:cation:proton antiporter [Stratiformator vulcanicus]|uniref:Inner membrane protein YbaL n=1 Tax=Stratiformator vulcanicus TaxID=2527980 RepID=A0A517R3U1_9PLAN|nr:cation:proton antiporter [Stratiformator vulcanicus]QDT38555.1 Inner membrane protein YbaL [Stratiformator vulcanicus]